MYPNLWYVLASTELEEKEIVPIPTLTALVVERQAIESTVSDPAVSAIPIVSETTNPLILDPKLGNTPPVTVSIRVITYYTLFILLYYY